MLTAETQMGKWYVGATLEHSHKVFDADEDYKICDCGDTDDGRKRAQQIVDDHNRSQASGGSEHG